MDVIGEYLKLSRSFNVGLTAIAPVLGALSNGEENLFYLFLFFLVGFFGHCYGFALNDIVDYKIDRLSRELVDRPLVSGKINLKNAWIFTVLMLILSFLFALWIAYIYSNFLSLLFLIFSAISITIYDFISKRMPAMDIFVAGGIFLLIIYGALTVRQNLSNLAIIVALLGTLQVLFMQFIAGGLKDVEHDFKGNAKTLAIKMGVRMEDGMLFIPPSFKALAYFLQILYFILLFYPFYAFEEFEGHFIQIFVLLPISAAMLYASHCLLGMKRFVRNEARKFIGMHYYINFSLVPVMLTVLNPFIFLIAFIPPAAFILSNLALHGSVLPKTM